MAMPRQPENMDSHARIADVVKQNATEPCQLPGSVYRAKKNDPTVGDWSAEKDIVAL